MSRTILNSAMADKKIVRLTEGQLRNIIRKVLNEDIVQSNDIIDTIDTIEDTDTLVAINDKIKARYGYLMRLSRSQRQTSRKPPPPPQRRR